MQGHSFRAKIGGLTSRKGHRQESSRELGPAYLILWEPLFPSQDTQKARKTNIPREAGLGESTISAWLQEA